MATRKELLQHLWNDVINANLRQDGLDNLVEHCKRNPNSPFADTGPAIERLLAAGASRRDLCLILRSTAYEAVFGTLYSLGDPGADGDDVFMLFEELLMADPSGMEGHVARQRNLDFSGSMSSGHNVSYWPNPPVQGVSAATSL